MLPSSYLINLLETGKIKAASSPADAAAAVADLPAAITAADASARLELPYTPPPLSMPAALWAATIFYHACRFLVYRQIGPDPIRAALTAPCPEPPSASSAYSVDLTLRYLPDLLSLARGFAEEDPLVQGLLSLAHAWPLSSVGIPLPPVDPTPFINDPCLATLYADRILLKTDLSRLNHPAVRKSLRSALGNHPTLNPTIAQALASPK